MKILATLVLALTVSAAPAPRKQLVVGAKHFTEGYIVSEIVAQLLERRGYEVIRKFNLGGTLVCYEALRNGAIDLYPEYTGTVARELLKSNADLSNSQLASELGAQNIGISSSLGFNNSYGLVTTKQTADQYRLTKISDLTGQPSIGTAISYEFLKRVDGWDALASTYSLPQKPVGIEHGLAYEALTQNQIAVTDCYTTDAEISKYGLTVLEDDRKFFPDYEAVVLYRSDVPAEVKQILEELANTITEEQMSALNLRAISKEPISQIAADFLDKTIKPGEARIISSGTFARSATQHLLLTLIALLGAIIVAVPLGVYLHWHPRSANFVLYAAGLLQTIPSIALLAFMIPVFGIGFLPAVVALFLYALLPILRNTVAGLRSVDPLLKEMATSMGMTRYQSIWLVEGPLALPLILAGIRIAAVISVGTATLAAFIGAGGFGEYIVTGLALNNTTMILQGAGAAAVMAILIELLFEVIEKRVGYRDAGKS